MQWIHSFQLYLFDFDGLLVNTEHIQFQAYLNALAQFGISSDWPFSRFCELAHFDGQALREALCLEYPQIKPIWQTFYEEKNKIYFELIQSGKVELMPGVSALLEALAQYKIRRCVVTNSFRHQTDLILSQVPILRTIPHWVTRESYERAKPAPDGYLRAIELYGKKGDRIIGFEDSVRGLKSLVQTPALPILICPSHHPLLGLAQGYAHHFESFADIPPTGWSESAQ